MNNHSPSSLNVDGKDKGRDYSMKEMKEMKGMKSNGQLNEYGGEFNGAEKISIFFEFVLSVISFFMKFRSVIKMLDIG
jgi:hypothetical protein